MQEDDHGPAEDCAGDVGAESELLDKELPGHLTEDVTLYTIRMYPEWEFKFVGLISPV